MKQIIRCALTIALSFSLTGCIVGGRRDEAKIRKMAIEYLNDKYDLNVNRHDIVDTALNTHYGKEFIQESHGKGYAVFKGGYTVYVDVKRNTIADDRQIQQLKDDIEQAFIREYSLTGEYFLEDFFITRLYPSAVKNQENRRTAQALDLDGYYNGNLEEFFKAIDGRLTLNLSIHWKNTGEDNLLEENQIFVDRFKENFKGYDTKILSAVFKESGYLSENVYAVMERNAGGSWSGSDMFNMYNPLLTDNYIKADYRYGDSGTLREYTWLAEDSEEAIQEYMDKNDYNRWLEESLCVTGYFELEKGLYVSPVQYNTVGHNPEDIIFKKIEAGETDLKKIDEFLTLYCHPYSGEGYDSIKLPLYYIGNKNPDGQVAVLINKEEFFADTTEWSGEKGWPSEKRWNPLQYPYQRDGKWNYSYPANLYGLSENEEMLFFMDPYKLFVKYTPS